MKGAKSPPNDDERDASGFAVAYVRCRRCQVTGTYRYTPYGLGNPIITCGCGAQKPDFEYFTKEQFAELTAPKVETREVPLDLLKLALTWGEHEPSCPGYEGPVKTQRCTCYLSDLSKLVTRSKP